MDTGFYERCGYEIDGMWLPRVTAITSQHQRSAYLTDRLAPAAKWGSEVHEGVEATLKGHRVSKDGPTSVSLRAFTEWFSKHPVSIASPQDDIEARVADFEEGYAGTIDLVAEVEGSVGVIDVKTTSGVTRQHRLQTAAYLSALRKERGLQTDKRWILRIDQHQLCLGCEAKVTAKYGSYKPQGGKVSCNHQWGGLQVSVELLELENFERDLEGFLEAKERWEWTNRAQLAEIPGYQKSVFTRVFV